MKEDGDTENESNVRRIKEKTKQIKWNYTLAWGMDKPEEKERAKILCKLMSLTRYIPKLFTTHVNETSRPWLTVKLSNGARNSGCGSVCWMLVPMKHHKKRDHQSKRKVKYEMFSVNEQRKIQKKIVYAWNDLKHKKMEFKSGGCDTDYSILIQEFYVFLYIRFFRVKIRACDFEDEQAYKMLCDCVVWYQ